MANPEHPLLLGRRAALWVAVGAAAVPIAGRADAQERPAVSPIVQAGLLAKVVSYDRNFAARAIDRAKLLLVAKPGDLESIRAVVTLKETLSSIATVGGLPHSEEITYFSDAATVARLCGSHRISIVYFGPGFSDEIEAIREALTSADVLSVAAVADYVPRGIVLGFSPPVENVRLLLNRRQARAQHVNFGARLLRRMTIYDG
jgi:YfiR/HmsC-like